MPENHQVDSDDKKRHDHNRAPNAGLWWIIGAGVLGLLALFFVSVYLPNLTERAKFFTGNALSLLVLGVIAVQAYIYLRQWEVMQEQKRITTIAERAYLGVKEVKITNPIMGDTLVIYGFVFNGGRTPARNVERKFQIGMMPEPTPFDWNNCSERSDFSLFPAGAERRFSFPDLPFTKEIFAEFEAGRRSIYLDGEFRFTDFMGVEQIYAFGMTCRASDNGDFHERYQRQYDANPN